MGSFLTRATGTGNSFAAGQANIQGQDFKPELANSLGQFNQTFGNQGALAAQLQQQALGQGPNPAQIQLQQATNRNVAQNAGFLSSQKGLSPALAARLAAQNQAQAGQQMAGQGALMGAQQQISAQQNLAGLYGQQQQGALGAYSTQQNALAGFNNAQVGMQSNMNNANAGVAAQNAATAKTAVGGLLGGAASSLFAKGGVVQGYGYGGAVDMPDSIRSGALNQPLSDIGQYLNTGDKDSSGNKSMYDGFQKIGSAGQTPEAARPYTDSDAMIMNSGGADMALPATGGAADAAGADVAAADAGGAAAGGGGLAGLAAMFAARGGKVPGIQYKDNGGAIQGLASLIPIAIAALNQGGTPQGQVPGQAAVKGDSLKNDKVPAMLSPGELIVDRETLRAPGPIGDAARLLEKHLGNRHGQKKSNFAEGGIPSGLDANAPVTDLQPVNTGFDPGQAMTPTPPRDYGQVYEQQYQQLRKLNPGEPDEFSRSSALNAAEQTKGADTMAQNWNQERQVSGMQASHDQAVAENARRMSLGLAPVPVPEAPARVAMQSQAPQQQAPAPGLNEIPNMQSPMGAMNDSMLGSYAKAAGEQKAGFNQAAQAQEQLGQANAGIAQNEAAGHFQLMQNFQQKQMEYMDQYEKAIEDYKNDHINPDHYAESRGSVGKVKTAIGLIMGGLAGGLTGTENPALKFMNQQIDRDIAAQQANLGKDQNLMTANYHKLGNLRDATDMTRAMMMGFQSSQFKEAAAKAQGPMAKAVALQEAGKLDERIAPIMSQIAMRQAMLKGGSSQVDPAMAIQFMAPEGQKVELMKQYQTAENMSKQKDNLLNAFDQVNKIQTVAGRLSSPLQSGRQAETLTQPLLAQLIKDSEGRITPQDTQMMEGLFPKPGDSDSTRRLKRNQLNKFVSEKMNFPGLKMYGFDPGSQGRFDATGKDRLPPMAPPKK